MLGPNDAFIYTTGLAESSKTNNELLLHVSNHNSEFDNYHPSNTWTPDRAFGPPIGAYP
jgi:hypothetical protein